MLNHMDLLIVSSSSRRAPDIAGPHSGDGRAAQIGGFQVYLKETSIISAG
jgi:hypothetical protein